VRWEKGGQKALFLLDNAKKQLTTGMPPSVNLALSIAWYMG
jgi:hypothetical protein